MRRIVLDGLPLAVRSAGVATYTRELTRAMAALAPDWSFALFQPPWPRRDDGDPPPRANVSTLRSWRYPLVMGQPAPWARAVLPLESVVGAVSAFHGTTYAIPARHRAPLVITVHDLALLRHPNFGSRALVAMVERAARGFARADRLIAVSEATRADIAELCDIDRARIDVVYNGCGSEFHPRDRDVCRRQVEAVFAVAGPFILHVGTLEPRKNLPNLIRAFARLRRERGIPHRLVLAGAPGWGGEPLREIAAGEGVADHVVLPGRVAKELLPILYGAADVFAYPSLYEGFGLPVIEAMASGTPIVASDRGALPEIAGGGARLVDPTDCDAIAGAIGELLDNPAQAAALTAEGLKRAAQFSWARAARETLAIYTSVIDGA